MRPGKKRGTRGKQIEEREMRKKQEDETGNCSGHFLHPSVGIQKGRQERLINDSRVGDEDLYKHIIKTHPIAADRGFLSHSGS